MYNLFLQHSSSLIAKILIPSSLYNEWWLMGMGTQTLYLSKYATPAAKFSKIKSSHVNCNSSKLLINQTAQAAYSHSAHVSWFKIKKLSRKQNVGFGYSMWRGKATLTEWMLARYSWIKKIDCILNGPIIWYHVILYQKLSQQLC